MSEHDEPAILARVTTDIPTESSDADSTDRSASSGPLRDFGSYVLLHELGRGAQGVVFLAEDKNLRRKVALKMLTGAGAQSQLVRDRFRREAELTSRFEHPGICGVHDVGEVDGMPYIAMQYVRGTTLAALVEKARLGSTAAGDASGRSSDTISIVGGGSKGGLEDVLRLIERAARALHVAHEAGLVHRDIKPANVMVTSEGHPVLLDFGLARDLDIEGQTLTQSGQILGTPAYLAPEQIVPARGQVDRRTDIYALGVTLFECLTLQRPFESSSWDQLFHEILDGEPRNPAKLNPRIPRDLRTVIEVAMDRDPARRYATAEALAEDLRRVRSFEPIQARADGPLTRAHKWSRRNPGRAASAAAAILFVLLGAGFFGWRTFQRARSLDLHLRHANEALVAADYVQAAVAVSKARELDPESLEVRALLVRVERGQAEAQRASDRRTALAGAAAARLEAVTLGESYRNAGAAIEQLTAELLKEQSAVLAHFADDATRAGFARRERELEALRVEAQRMLLARSEALERARRLEDPWDGISAATQSALAEFYLERWREALKRRDTVLAAAMRTAVERHDPSGEHREELLGRGTLTVTVVPTTAQIHLFRYEAYEAQRGGDVIPRLVPVPTAGIGHARTEPWPEGFHPGDPCLVVTSVDQDSSAARAGLEPGDLVLAVAGLPAADALGVRAVSPHGRLSGASLDPLTRIIAVDGFTIANRFDWMTRAARRGGAVPLVTFAGHDEAQACTAEDLAVVSPLELLHETPSTPLEIATLQRGEAVFATLPQGTPTGLQCHATAYPLVRSPMNRIAAQRALTVDPGSYLLLVHAAGYEDQRIPIRVERGGTAAPAVTLQPSGTTPPGFIPVPAGRFVSAGDPGAFRPREARVLDVPSFSIARFELTNREWYEFVNDARTLQRIAESSPDSQLYLPQDDRVMAKRTDDGTFTWDVYVGTTADSPVLGLSWTDVRDYLAWRNELADTRREPWRYDLPSAAEWEKAARGVDERLFPWGDRFDPSLSVCLVRQDVYLLDAPGGYELRDESPYGVRDLAGSREEWLRDRVGEVEPPRYLKRGGHWSTAVEAVFHSASDGEASQDRHASTQGVRLVARRP